MNGGLLGVPKRAQLRMLLTLKRNFYNRHGDYFGNVNQHAFFRNDRNEKQLINQVNAICTHI